MTPKDMQKASPKQETIASQAGCENDLRIVYAIRKIIRTVDMDSRKLAAERQITGPQLICLMAIVEKGTITSVEIAKRVHLSPSTIVGVLDRLESKNLIRRQRSSEDRREVSVSATTEGKALAVQTPYPLQFTLDRAMKRMSPQERESIVTSIERLVELLGAQDADTRPLLDIVAHDEE